MPRSKDFLNEVFRAGYRSTTHNSCKEEYFEGEEIDKDDPSKSYRWMTHSDGSKELYCITTEESNGRKFKRYLPKGKTGWQSLTITEETLEGEKIIYAKMTYVGMEDLLNDYLSSLPQVDGNSRGLVPANNANETPVPIEWITKFVPNYE